MRNPTNQFQHTVSRLWHPPNEYCQIPKHENGGTLGPNFTDSGGGLIGLYLGYQVGCCWCKSKTPQRVPVNGDGKDDNDNAEVQMLLLSELEEEINNDLELRRALCQRLELPDETALDDIGSEMTLQRCVECLEELPVDVRMTFVQWVTTKIRNNQDEELLELELTWIHDLIASLPVNREDLRPDDHNHHEIAQEEDTLRQVFVLLLTHVRSFQHGVFLQALEAALPHRRPRWLDIVSRLHQDAHQVGWTQLLGQLQARYIQGGVEAIDRLVHVILALVSPLEQPNHNDQQQEDLVVIQTLFQIMQRLQSLPEQEQGRDAVGGCLRGLSLCAADQVTRLVWNLQSLPLDGLRFVALSFAVSDNEQIPELIETLLSPPMNNNNHGHGNAL